MRTALLAVGLLMMALLPSSEPAHAYLLLYAPGGGGVPCGATQAFYDTTCNAILSGDMEMPL